MEWVLNNTPSEALVMLAVSPPGEARSLGSDGFYPVEWLRILLTPAAEAISRLPQMQKMGAPPQS